MTVFGHRGENGWSAADPLWHRLPPAELRQWAPLQAAVVWGLSLGLGLALQRWGLALLGTALALSLLRDAALLRRSARRGELWLCQGEVVACDGRRVTLRQGGQQVTLQFDRSLRLRPGDRCRLALAWSPAGAELLGLTRTRPAMAKNFLRLNAMISAEYVL